MPALILQKCWAWNRMWSDQAVSRFHEPRVGSGCSIKVAEWTPGFSAGLARAGRRGRPWGSGALCWSWRRNARSRGPRATGFTARWGASGHYRGLPPEPALRLGVLTGEDLAPASSGSILSPAGPNDSRGHPQQTFTEPFPGAGAGRTRARTLRPEEPHRDLVTLCSPSANPAAPPPTRSQNPASSPP